MRRIKILLLILLCAKFAVAQNDCASAVNGFTQYFQNIPPSGTQPTVGPNYGCLTHTGRQVWYYFPVCLNTKISPTPYYNIGVIGNNGYMGAVFYGPFSQKVTNCNELDSSKIIACSQQYYSGGQFNLQMTDTLFAGNYYYLLCTFQDSAQFNNVFPSPLGIGGNLFNCFECNNQVSVLDARNLCLLTVDTAINKCVLTWEEFQGTNLMGYQICRESTLTGIYDSLTTIPVGGLSTYTDMTSSPLQHNYTYAITAVDSCNNYYPVVWNTPSLTTIHLLSFPGGNNQAQLIWNNIYQQGTFAPQYFIYRNSNGAGWQLIDSIGITLPTITYTDIFAPPGNNQYTVELHQLASCFPMRNSSLSYHSVFSNVSTALVTSYELFTNNPLITVSPNPSSENVVIDVSLLNQNKNSISIFNLQGIKIYSVSNTAEKKIAVSVKNFAQGVYTVVVENSKLFRSKLIVQ